MLAVWNWDFWLGLWKLDVLFPGCPVLVWIAPAQDTRCESAGGCRSEEPQLDHSQRRKGSFYRQLRSVLQQKLLRAVQVVGVDQVHTISEEFAPERGEIRRAPETHAPALLVRFVHDFFEFLFFLLRDGSSTLPMKCPSPIAADPGNKSGGRPRIQIVQVTVQGGDSPH